MKKLFFILVAFGLALYMTPLAVVQAGNPQEDTVCAGLKGPAFGLCVAYCLAEDNDCVANPDTDTCEDLRTNNEKINGSRYFPCDQLIACGLCADTQGAGTVGECIEVLPFECEEPAIDFGEYSCSQILLPAYNETYESCIIPARWGIIPACQNGLPAWVCAGILKGTVLPPNSCPYLPSCEE